MSEGPLVLVVDDEKLVRQALNTLLRSVGYSVKAGSRSRTRLAFQEALEKSRRELEHAAQAAMIGEISASIAYAVNQPLSAIMAFIQAAQR
ncbi:hypothetical protein ACO34A_27755 (plasmid) [Rhizobium sp. ACO-34A]|nr:hypothetical protein [Rhizobium sp. ACO-34A]ATN37570.1 hypothetical protein ACO34A_27755 [Rhizobium sp. ACO-34A]